MVHLRRDQLLGSEPLVHPLDAVCLAVDVASGPSPAIIAVRTSQVDAGRLPRPALLEDA